MILRSARPIAWMLLTVAVLLAVLELMIRQDFTHVITPEPHNAAEGLVTALSAHRYAGAMNQLSQELKQQVGPEDLRALVERIEQSGARGIYDAHGQESTEQGTTAAATVEVVLSSGETVTVKLPLVKENGIWRVSSLEPLEILAR